MIAPPQETEYAHSVWLELQRRATHTPRPKRKDDPTQLHDETEELAVLLSTYDTELMVFSPCMHLMIGGIC